MKIVLPPHLISHEMSKMSGILGGDSKLAQTNITVCTIALSRNVRGQLSLSDACTNSPLFLYSTERIDSQKSTPYSGETNIHHVVYQKTM